jgi:DNA sulfur modification protein DndC
MVRELLDVEQRHRSQARRSGLFDSLERALRRGFYDDETDATLRAQKRKDAMDREQRSREEDFDERDLGTYVQPAGSVVSE